MSRPGGAAGRRWLVPLGGTAVVGAAALVVGSLVAGTRGTLAACLGATLVIAFFATARAPLALAEQARLRTGAGVAFVVLTFVFRWVLVLVVLAVAATTDAVHGRTLGTTVIACGLAWSSLQLAVVLARARRT